MGDALDVPLRPPDNEDTVFTRCGNVMAGAPWGTAEAASR